MFRLRERRNTMITRNIFVRLDIFLSLIGAARNTSRMVNRNPV